MIDKIIHNKLDELQFLPSIESGKFLIVKIPYVGYGGQLSMRMLGMRMAYIFNRTVIFEDCNNPYINCYKKTSSYSVEELKHFPVTKLKLYEKQNDKVVYLDFDEYWLNFKNRRYFDKWLPIEIKKQQIKHKKEYFDGQLLLRFKLLPEYEKQIESVKERILFSKPIIGVHIRRGDKKNESSYVPMRIYNHYIKKAVKESGIKKVFVTSDSPDVFSELPQNLGLEYIYDREEKRYNNANHELLTNSPNLKEQETFTAVKIINLLSDCDYIIGQVNTHFTTLAYDIGLTKSDGNTKIYFVNKDLRDTYINNDPNIILKTIDIFKKYIHLFLVHIVRKVKPFIFTNKKMYKKIKRLYYGEEREKIIETQQNINK